MAEDGIKTITIDEIVYNVDDLSENALAQLKGIQAAMNEIRNLDIQKAMIETAKNAYQLALSNDLPKPAATD